MPPKKNIEKKNQKMKETILLKRNHGDSQETVIQLNLEDNKKFNISQINDFAKSFEAKLKASKRDMKYMIKAVAPDGMKTMKGYYTGYQELKDEENYYQGKVKDAGKFTDEFAQIVLYVLEPVDQEFFSKKK
jgi:hypothetical protein